ncbi:Transthyretin family protein [Trichostrongylus colubriformis]|uniref:Transthyretin family protein n=1 Tax=Trichostrongylus colubriformis TaxID=6319 RepID=A0AAN8FYW5_TRICO
MRSLVLLAILATCYLSVMAKMQNVTVKGITVCNKKRLANVHVELYDRDTCRQHRALYSPSSQLSSVKAIVDPDDLLAETRTNSEGEFQLYGEHDEVGTIEPFVRITHNCYVTKPGCMRVSDYYVPTNLLGGVYDMTYTTLDIVVQGESEKCE